MAGSRMSVGMWRFVYASCDGASSKCEDRDFSFERGIVRSTNRRAVAGCRRRVVMRTILLVASVRRAAIAMRMGSRSFRGPGSCRVAKNVHSAGR